MKVQNNNYHYIIQLKDQINHFCFIWAIKWLGLFFLLIRFFYNKYNNRINKWFYIENFERIGNVFTINLKKKIIDKCYVIVIVILKSEVK